MEAYDGQKLGGRQDRQEGNNGNTCAIYVYVTPEDYEAGKYQPVTIFDEILAENPLYWLSNKETDRMKALALERLDYMKEAFAEEGNQILIKVGLLVDKEFRSDDNDKEHIWFELLALEESEFQARLTQEPYYIEGLHEGDENWYRYEQITDWLIFTPEGRISPDDVYLLENMPTHYNDNLN